MTRRGGAGQDGWRAAALTVSLTLALAQAGAVARAAETRWWVTDAEKELLDGRGDGVAVTSDGRLERVGRWAGRVGLEEPVVMAGVQRADGAVVVGTGYPARLYEVGERGATLLAEVPAVQVTAAVVRSDGAVLVGTMGPGLLLEWQGGRLTELARIGDGGIWDLVEYRGQVVVAAGPPASLYRLTAAGLERWAELPDTHARCLAATADALLVGTSGKGLIFSVSAAGQIALLEDSPFTEISDLLVAPDRSVWAAALVGEPPKPEKPAQGEQTEETASSTTAPPDLDLPKVDGSTATSEVVRLTPEGALLHVRRFTRQIATSLAWDGAGVLVGTGFEGEVWRFGNSGGARMAAVDAVQVMAFVGQGAALLTQGPASVLWRRDEGEATYRVAAKQFPRPVRFGEYRALPPQAGARIRFRTGASEKPDDSWLPWSDWMAADRGLVPMSVARSLQWELQLAETGGLAPAGAVERVEVAWREVNLAPRLDSVEVEDPGVIYLSSPPPSGPVIDVTHPEQSGIFSVLDEKGPPEGKPKQGKKYWRVGFRTVTWQAGDPNEDPLRFEVEVEDGNGFRLPVREDLDGTQLALDTSALPDGEYRFAIRAGDGEANPEEPLEASALSEWFVVDNTPPVLELQRSGQTGAWSRETPPAR